MKRSLSLFALGLILILHPSAWADPADPDAVVKVKKTILRAKADKSAKAVIALTNFSPVKVLEKKASWSKVRTPGGARGFVRTSDLALSPFVSVKAKYANVRSGPGKEHPVLFRLETHYPLRVKRKQGNYLNVVDYEGDTGWVHENLLSPEKYVIVKLKLVNLRDGPGMDSNGRPTHQLLFTAEKGVIFRVVEVDPKTGWIHLRHPDQDEGWCSPKIVWGHLVN